MRRFDKDKHIAKANILAEQRYLKSKGLIKENTSPNHVKVKLHGKLLSGFLSKNGKYVFFTMKEDSAGTDYRPDKFFVMVGHNPEVVNDITQINGRVSKMGEIYDTENDALKGAYEHSINH